MNRGYGRLGLIVAAEVLRGVVAMAAGSQPPRRFSPSVREYLAEGAFRVLDESPGTPPRFVRQPPQAPARPHPSAQVDSAAAALARASADNAWEVIKPTHTGPHSAAPFLVVSDVLRFSSAALEALGWAKKSKLRVRLRWNPVTSRIEIAPVPDGEFVLGSGATLGGTRLIALLKERGFKHGRYPVKVEGRRLECGVGDWTPIPDGYAKLRPSKGGDGHGQGQDQQQDQDHDQQRRQHQVDQQDVRL